MYIRLMLGLIGVLALIIAIELAHPRRRMAASVIAAVEDPENDTELDRRLAEVSFDHVPFGRAITMLAAQTHAKIVIDDSAEGPPNYPSMVSDFRVTLTLHNVTLRGALQALMNEISAIRSCTLGVLECGVIEIRGDFHPDREQTHVYDVRDLVSRPENVLITIPNTSASELFGPISNNANHFDLRASLIANLPQGDELRLFAAIQDVLDPFRGRHVAPTAFLVPGVLITNASPKTNRSLRQLLVEVRHPIGRGESVPSGNAATDALRQRIAELSLDHAPFHNVIDMLRDAFHVNIITRWDDLPGYEVTPQTPVSIHRRNASLAEIFVEILAPLGKTYDAPGVGFFEGDDFITIGLARETVDDAGIAHIYDVSDLLEVDAGWARSLHPLLVAPSMVTREDRARMLIDVIKAEVDQPGAESEGRAGVYTYWRGRLFVRHLSTAHLKIETLLNKFRAK